MAEPTLRTRCYRARVSPKRSLAVARLLRLLVLGPSTGDLPADLVDAKDPRTLSRLLAHARLENHGDGDRWPTPDDFLEFQALVTSRWAIDALMRRVHSSVAPTGEEANKS